MLHYFRGRCWRTFAALAVPAGAAALLLGTAACGGSSAPPSAAAVLKADGYTFRISQAQLASIGAVLPAKYKPYVTSIDAGVKPGGNNPKIEVVVILTSPGASKITPSDLVDVGQGYTASLSGDVLRFNTTARAIGS